MERLKIIKEQAIEQARLQQFEQKPEALANRMVYLLVRIYGLGLETADLLAHELLSRTLRDRKAVARYAGLTGSPDESGSKRREKGLSRSGNARVRKIMIQLAWRMVKFQPDSALVQWFKQRTFSIFEDVVRRQRISRTEICESAWKGSAASQH
jgi:transposase